MRLCFTLKLILKRLETNLALLYQKLPPTILKWSLRHGLVSRKSAEIHGQRLIVFQLQFEIISMKGIHNKNFRISKK